MKTEELATFRAKWRKELESSPVVPVESTSPNNNVPEGKEGTEETDDEKVSCSVLLHVTCLHKNSC